MNIQKVNNQNQPAFKAKFYDCIGVVNKEDLGKIRTILSKVGTQEDAFIISAAESAPAAYGVAQIHAFKGENQTSSWASSLRYDSWEREKGLVSEKVLTLFTDNIEKIKKALTPE